MTSVPSRVAAPDLVDDRDLDRPQVDAAGSDRHEVAAESGPVRTRPSRWVVVGLLLLLTVPLLSALIALTSPRWYPILDLAMTELRVRDVGTRRTPLIGLPGRIGVLGGEQGSHPGPISFWLLAPVYRLLGTDAWSLQAATVVLHAAAMGVALFVARRRGGLGVVLGVVLLLSVLTRAYGAGSLTEPWNPYMPLLWWVVLLLTAWSVLDRDVKMLPVAVFAGSVCAQTHAPYMLIVLGVGGLALLGAANQLRSSSGPDRRRILVWLALAVAVGGALWSPPVYDQLRREPGNISMLIEHFSAPSEEPVGIRLGVEMILLHLDPWRLLTEQQAATGSLVDASPEDGGSLIPGAIVLIGWLGTVALAWRMRHWVLLRLHLVVGVALLLGVFSISRIFGQVWYYLMIWAWGITAVLLFAAVWTIAAHLTQRRSGAAGEVPTGRIGLVALAAATVVSTVIFAIDAADTEEPAVPLSAGLTEVVPEAVRALEEGSGPGRGPDGRYLVGWTDAYYMGSQGMGLVNELDREGFDVGVIKPWSVPMTKHRLRAPEDASAIVQLVTGVHVERWREKPGVEELAFFDPRTDAEVEEYERLRSELVDEVTALGLQPDSRVADVDVNVFSLAIDPRITPSIQEKLTRLLELGTPTAIFVGPVEASD